MLSADKANLRNGSVEQQLPYGMVWYGLLHCERMIVGPGIRQLNPIYMYSYIYDMHVKYICLHT